MFFFSLPRYRYFFSFFTFFQFYSGQPGSQNLLFARFSFLLTICRSDRQADVRWSVVSQIPEKLSHLIPQGGSLVLHIPLVYMIKFKFLAQFPVDHLPHSVVSSRLLFSRYFTAFAYYVINLFISITTNLHLLFCYVLSIFALTWFVLITLFCVVIRRYSVSLLTVRFRSSV